MHIPIKIGALSVIPETHPVLFNYLQSIGNVVTLGPDTWDVKLDIVVLPPGMGISPNLQCFSHGNYDAMPVAMISPTIERFRNRMLEKYINAEIHVIGIGDNATLLWNHLGYKAAITSSGTVPLYQGEKVEILGKADSFLEGFRFGNIIGITNLNHLTSVLARVREEIGREADGHAEVQNVVPKQNPPLEGKEVVQNKQTNKFKNLFEDNE